VQTCHLSLHSARVPHNAYFGLLVRLSMSQGVSGEEEWPSNM